VVVGILYWHSLLLRGGGRDMQGLGREALLVRPFVRPRVVPVVWVVRGRPLLDCNLQGLVGGVQGMGCCCYRRIHYAVFLR
jgi:hypothetical protein